MRIVPFEVLERHAREEYQKRFANAPEPRVINVRALTTLDAPRSFIWGGVGYWAPPLSFESGFRLLVAANALRDLRDGGDPAALERAKIRAARLVRSVLRCRRLWWRLTRAFYRDPPAEVEEVIRHLLYVEDESPVIPSDRPVTVDMVDNLYTFEAAFGRRPRSWRDYVYGMRHIGRANSRGDLRGAVATRIGVNSDEKGWKAFERDMRLYAGWN